MAALASGILAALAAVRLVALARKTRYALVGELGSDVRLSTVARDSLDIAGLYLCNWRMSDVLAWLRTLLTRQGPLASAVPWIPYPAIRFLEAHLGRNSRVFEYGGGGSTLWLAERAGAVTTVEHDAGWYEVLHAELRSRSLSNIDLRLMPPSTDSAAVASSQWPGVSYSSSRIEGSFEEYVRTIEEMPDSSLDLVIVDGRCRPAALLHAASKVKSCGLLMLDDSYRRRYDVGKVALDSWDRTEFCGIRPYSLSPSRTTFWVRPAGMG